MKWALAVAVALLVVLPAFPALFGSYLVTIFTLIFFFGYLAQAWNVLSGYAGQLSAGHAAFVGIGGYTGAVLYVEAGITPWLGMLAGGVLAAAVGAFIGFLGFRFGLRGFYFVLLTVAFAEIFRILANNVEAVGGAVGYYITFTGNPRQFQFQDARAYYYITLVMMLLATGLVAALQRRRLGVYLAAIRQDETAAEAAGIDTFRYKLLAMVLSSFLTGVGGSVYAFYVFSLQPNAVFGIPLSVEIIVRAIVGGSGTVLGPILGSFILGPLAEISRHYLAGGWIGVHLVVYGALLVVVVLFLPEGAYPRLQRALARRRRA